MTREEFSPDLTRDKLMVAPRPNVRQQDYRPRDWALGPDWHDPTYTWQCKCGARPTLRHDRIGAYYWLEHVAGGNGCVVATVGRDL